MVNTKKERILRRAGLKKMPLLLDQEHSLKSITEEVVIRYLDRPGKLSSHLPFAVDYRNESSPVAPSQPANEQRPLIISSKHVRTSLRGGTSDKNFTNVTNT